MSHVMGYVSNQQAYLNFVNLQINKRYRTESFKNKTN